MKPIHLNLASRPYRDYRPVYAAVVVMSLVVAFLMLNNVDTYYRYIHETRTTRAKIAQLEAQTEQERRLAAAADQRLKTLDLNRLDVQSRFVNAKLAERAFSWSALLDQLETILADNVRIVAVTPAFTETGTIELGLSLESKSSGGMVETLERMGRDSRFVNPFPTNETMQDPDRYTFGINVQYQPDNLTAKAVAR